MAPDYKNDTLITTLPHIFGRETLAGDDESSALRASYLPTAHLNTSTTTKR
jgi:hypothetical protein